MLDTLFGRNPAMLCALLYAAVSILCGDFLHFDGTKQGLVNSGLAALVGLIVTLKAHKDKAAAAIYAVIKTGMAVLVGFGITYHGQQLDAPTQAHIMSLASIFLMYMTRQSITAPVDADGNKRDS
jgi:hypothetical protein